MLDVPTTRVAYVKVTPTISNWIQPIAIGSRSNPPRDVDRTDRDRVASVDSVAVGSRSSCQCGQALTNVRVHEVSATTAAPFIVLVTFFIRTITRHRYND